MRGLLAAFALCVAGAGIAPAQSAPDGKLLSQIVTIDQEELFLRSTFARQLQAEVEVEAAELAAENRRIEADLTAEERQLTEDRPNMTPEAFRALAQEFDEKVVGIRSAQDAKARQIVRARETVQQEFFQKSMPLVTEIVRARGALVVLDSSSVVLSAGQIDITDEALVLIDNRLAAPEDTGAEPLDEDAE